MAGGAGAQRVVEAEEARLGLEELAAAAVADEAGVEAVEVPRLIVDGD